MFRGRLKFYAGVAAGTRVCHQRRHSRFPGDTGSDHPSVPASNTITPVVALTEAALQVSQVM